MSTNVPLTCGGRASRRTRRRSGFTLVELLVVIGIIALLISILLPALSKVRAHANTVACKAHLRQFSDALQIYLIQNKNIYPYALAPNWRRPNDVSLRQLPYYGYNGMALLYPLVPEINLYACPQMADIFQPPTTGTSVPGEARWVVNAHYRINPYLGQNTDGPGLLPGYAPGAGQLGRYTTSAFRRHAEKVFMFDAALEWRSWVTSPGLAATDAWTNAVGDGDRTNPANYGVEWMVPNIGFHHPGERTNIAFMDGHVEGLHWNDVLLDETDEHWRFERKAYEWLGG